jgi:hypothetical protein
MGKLAMPANRSAIHAILAVCWGSDIEAKQNYALAWPLMEPPDRYSASPLPSYATRPPFAPRPVSFLDSFKAIWRWWLGDRLTQRERQIEAVAVERLAEEMAEASETASKEAVTPTKANRRR